MSDFKIIEMWLNCRHMIEVSTCFFWCFSRSSIVWIVCFILFHLIARLPCLRLQARVQCGRDCACPHSTGCIGAVIRMGVRCRGCCAVSKPHSRHLKARQTLYDFGLILPPIPIRSIVNYRAVWAGSQRPFKSLNNQSSINPNDRVGFLACEKLLWCK